MAFVVNVVRLVGTGSTVTRRQVEVATGLDHTRWPMAEAERLGLYLLDPGVSGEEMAGEWAFQGGRAGQIAPTAGASTTSTTPTSSGSRSTEVTRGGGVLSALADPLLDHWQALGRFSWDGWRLHALARDEVVDTRLIRSRLGMDDRRARRLLAALRAEGLVLDGRWNQRYIDEAEQHSTRRARIGDRVQREVQQWGARRRVVAEAERLVAGRFRGIEVFGQIEDPQPQPEQPRPRTAGENPLLMERLMRLSLGTGA